MSYHKEFCRRPGALLNFLALRRGEPLGRIHGSSLGPVIPSVAIETWHGLPVLPRDASQTVVFESRKAGKNGSGEEKHDSRRCAKLYFLHGDRLPSGLSGYFERHRRGLERKHPLLFRARIQRGQLGVVK